MRICISPLPITIVLWFMLFSTPTVRGEEIRGRLYDPTGGWKELFVWTGRVGESRLTGNFTDMGGYFSIGVSEPGTYTVGFSRRFGLGPVISPGVAVEHGNTAYVLLLQSWPLDVRGGKQRLEGHKTYAQSFVSRGECVRRARLDVDEPAGTELIYAVRESRPDGRQIGPDSADGQWPPGQVRLARDKTCFLTVRRKDGQALAVLTTKADKTHMAFADGQEITDAIICGRVVTDRTGIIVDNSKAEGEFFGPCKSGFCQTFVARGTGLAMIDFIPAVGGGRRQTTRYTVRILEDGPGGRQVGPTKLSSGSDMIPSAALGFELRAVLYDRGELPLVPGRKYCIDIVGEPKSFRITTHPGNLMDGEFLMDGRTVSDRCLDATIIEYEPDDCPPPSARNLRADLAGTAVQLSFDVPADMDVNSAAITRSAGTRTKQLAKLYSCPGRMALYVDRSAEPNQTYVYQVELVDAAGNKSEAVSTRVEVKPLTPESNLLINGDFVASTSASGGLCPGWDTAGLAQNARWSIQSPGKKGDSYAISAWQQWSTYDVVTYQRVPVVKGTTYLLSAMTNRKEPFNDGNVNETTLVGIDPLGGSDASTDSVVWSSAEYAPDKWTLQKVRARAEADTITVYLRARSLQPGFGMEGLFSKASLKVATDSPGDAK